MAEPSRLPRKPEARSEKVEELVDLVRRGVIRVPSFQRGLRWQSNDIVKLFDSIYRGFPLGSLLFYKRPAEADRLAVGPLIVEAPELVEGWWVVDGQQRVTALAACLARPTPLPTTPDDPYVLYFDASERRFVQPPRSGIVPSTWVPLPYLLDASRLQEWIFGWKHAQDPELRTTVFDAGTRIREYAIPLYLIEMEGQELAREIFYRVNEAGKPLDWTEVHSALFGSDEEFPSKLADLAGELQQVGMGTLDESRLLTSLIAMRGQDPTRTLADHVSRDPEVLSGAVREALPVLRRVLSLLRRDAGIVHLRLLPKSILLDVLVRFFALHADPVPRTRRLLARWFWRSVLGAGVYDDRTMRRSGIKAIGNDEEASAQALLGLLRKERTRPLDLPANFDSRADASRIAMLALAHLCPRDLTTGQPLDVTRLLEEQDKDAFARILKQPVVGRSQSPANRIIQPKGRLVRQALVERLRGWGAEDPVVVGHAIRPAAAACLLEGDAEGFLAQRAKDLTAEMQRFADLRAEWEQSDRPSLDYVLAGAGEEP